MRLAFIVSHPIQYYAPLHQLLAQRDDLVIKVFFTWHAAEQPVHDQGFNIPVAWDIPLTQGYDFELVPNTSSEPGTHHFSGLRNPSLVDRVLAWQPDAVHVTGWAWLSHFVALRAFQTKRIPTLFRGDSHLLDEDQQGLRWWLKSVILKKVFSWPSGFLVTGSANRAYYQAFGVEARRLYDCPHSIDVARFSKPDAQYEDAARKWRQELGIADDRCVILFAGKFERKKRPLELMRAVQSLPDRRQVLVMIGGGDLDVEVKAIASEDPDRFRVLPFQNQTRMPIVYRLSDLFVLPSAYGETWGLGVNEALACGRPVLVSDHVGCAADVVDASCGRIFASTNPSALKEALAELTKSRDMLLDMRRTAKECARRFDISATAATLLAALQKICPCEPRTLDPADQRAR